MSRQDPRWLLPRQQTEYPARDLISEDKLHARRESTFLLLAALVVTATTAIVLVGTTRVIDLTALIQSWLPNVELGVALVLPLGMLPCAFAFVAVMMVCQLYGARRANGLLWASAFAAGVAVGLSRLNDLVDGRDAAFGPALALAAYSVTGQLANVAVFNAHSARTGGRRFWIRAFLTTLVAQIVGGAALMGVLHGYAVLDAQPDVPELTGLALGSAAYGAVSTLVLVLPATVAVHALALYLRVARFVGRDDDDYRDGPHGAVSSSMVVEASEAAQPPPVPRARRVSRQPFSSAEMRFFSEGDSE